MNKIIFDRYKRIHAIVKGKSVLDLGCVDHNLLSRDRSVWLHDVLRTSARVCVGVDYEKEAVETLRGKGYDIRVGDVESLALGQTYDVVVAGELIEHVPNPGKLLGTARRHLAEQGLLVLTTPNATGLYYFLGSLCFGSERDNEDHCLMFTRCTLTKLLDKCGFDVIEATYILGWTPQGHTSSLMRGLAWIKNVAKTPLYWAFPTLCHRFIVVARPRAV